MVRSKATTVEKVVNVLSESERETLRELKAEAEDTLKHTGEFGKGTSAEQIDEGRVKAEIAHYEKALHDGSPVVRGKKYDDLVREGMRISEILEKGLPTRDEMRHPSKNPGAVRKHLKWVHSHAEANARYENIRKTLGADCELPSVEQLRKEK